MLKLALAALALVSSVSMAAEIRVLENFDKVTKKYTGTISSTTEVPLSLAPALNPVNGLCYKGDYIDASELLVKMVSIFNAEQSAIELSNVNITFTGNDGSPLGLKVDFKSETEIGTWEWTSIPRCAR